MAYFILLASKDHVEKGVENGVAQVGHGKRSQLAKLKKGDWIIYYSSKEKYGDSKPFQYFTAMGKVVDDEAFQVSVDENFKPWRRKVEFIEAKEQPIRPLLDKFEFITNRQRWGLHLMSGFLEINKHDFELIANHMDLRRMD